jgi:hypothetical protein
MINRLKDAIGLQNRAKNQQTPRNLTAETQRRTSSCEFREAQIYLHDVYRRRSSIDAEAAEQHISSMRRRISKTESENKNRLASLSPSTQEEQKVQSSNIDARTDLKIKYQRYTNVYAAPLQQVENFVAPVFPKSDEGVQFLKKSVSKMSKKRTFCRQ